jgi:ribosomal-protein-alanine N-acetyltransferase
MYNSDTFYITELELEDAFSLHHLMVTNKMHFRQYLPVTLSQNLSLSASEAYIIQKKKENEASTVLTYALKEKETKVVCGLIILKNIDTAKKQGEFAFGLGKAYNGRGWMSQAVKVFSLYAYTELHLKKLQIITHKTNIGSSKVAEKNGYIWQRTLKNEYTPPKQGPLDMELYELNL